MKTRLHNSFLRLSIKRINRFYFIHFLHKPVFVFIVICMALVSVKAHNKTINPNNSKGVHCKVDRESNIFLGRKKSPELNLSVNKIIALSNWIGVNNNWNDPLNWSLGSIPDATTDVMIPVTLVNPIISSVSGIGRANGITIDPGAILTVTGSTLQIAGIITNNNRIFDILNGTIDFIGTAAQTIAGNMFVNSTIKNLTISNNNGGLTIGGGIPLYITGDISFGNVTGASLNTGNNIVLVSNSTSTARVADITNNGSNPLNTISGKVTVERYFAAHRAWRLLTSPLSNTGNIFNSWQAGGGNYIAGKGMFVSGPGATNANGLDFSSFGNYSMYTFDPIASNYVGVGDTKTQLLSPNTVGPANTGYFTFVRGDRNRSPDNTVFPNQNNTTLSSTGVLQTGPQTFNINSGNLTFQLIGNPYASPIDFAKIGLINVNPDRFYVHDPNIGSVGAFVVMEDLGIPGTFTPTNIATSLQTNNIQSGQAFFVQVTGPSASVSFNESNKSNNNNPSLFRPAKPLGQRQSFLISLLQLNASDSTLLVDGSLVEFDDSFNAQVDIQDALKFTNINENLGIQRDNKTLTLERRPIIRIKDTVFLQLTRTTQRSYRLEFTPTSLDPLLTAFLEDGFTGSSTPLSVFSKFKYDFDITGDAKSSAPNRFRIVFKQAAANGPLPVTYKKVAAYELAGNISVEWTVENELNIKNYEVEKSTDGINFVKVNTTSATGASLTSIAYKWIDANASGGNNFYRIRNIGIDGKSEYSIVVLVKMGKVFSKIRVYPNPVTNGVVIAEFKNMALGIYNIRLLNNLGQTMLFKTIRLATGTSMETIEPTQALMHGIYQLKITAPSKEITTLKVIIK